LDLIKRIRFIFEIGCIGECLKFRDFFTDFVSGGVCPLGGLWNIQSLDGKLGPSSILMKSIQKVLISLLISMVAAGFFYLAGIFGLFETLEYIFYENRIQDRVTNELARTETLLTQFERDISHRTEDILQQPAFRQAFLINQTANLIQQRRQIIQESFTLTPGITSLRIFEPDFSRLYYSTRITDILESSTQRIVYRPVSDIVDLVFLQNLVPSSLEYEKIYVLDPRNNLFYLIRPVFDDVNILRGHGVFIGTFRPFENRLIQNGLLPVDRSSFFLNDQIFIVNIDDSIRNALQVLDITQLQTTDGLFGRVDIDENRFVFLSFTGQIYTFATLIPEHELVLSDPLQWFLVILIFSSVFLFVFLLLNLRHDSVVIITDRIKRFQISLIQEYLENKENLDLHKWKTELRLRKDDVYNQILKGLPKRKRNDKALESLLDSSWEEILEVLGSKKMLTAGTSQLDIDRIEQAMQRVVSSLQNVELSGKSIAVDGTKKSKKAAPKQITKNVPKLNQPIDVEVISQGKDAELDDLEELDELDELTELEEAEELTEVVELDEIEEADELQDADTDEIEELEDLDELEELDESEAESEADEIEEIEQKREIVNQVEQDIEDFEELDELEELNEADELEEIQELEDEVSEYSGDASTVEIETDIEELVELEDFDELEELVELEEQITDASPDESSKEPKPTQEEKLINALNVDALESLENTPEGSKVQAVQEINQGTLDDTDAEELEEFGEFDELEEIEELISELENNVREVTDESDDELVEEAIELPPEHYTDSLVNMASYLQSPLWSRSMDNEKVEDLEPLDALEEEESVEDTEPIFLLVNFLNLLDEEEKVFTTNAQGVIQISEAVYNISNENLENPLNSVDLDNLDAETSEESDDFFGIPDIDFDMPKTVGDLVGSELPIGPRYYRKKEYGEIKFTQKGFDFDAFASTFRKDGPGRVKSLVTLSRLLNSRFAAIFTENDRGIFYKSGVGYSGEVSPMSPEDPLLLYYLKRDSITLLLNTSNYSYLMPQHEKSMGTLNQLVFVPCIYEGETGYVILGPSETLKKPQEFMQYFQALMAQPIQSK